LRQIVCETLQDLAEGAVAYPILKTTMTGSVEG
jgi:hypothetical protein